MRLEDLLGFRRNPTQPTPYFKSLKARALDGHPTPAVPFVPVATGASGVGLGAAVGLALGAGGAAMAIPATRSGNTPEARLPRPRTISATAIQVLESSLQTSR